MEKTLPEPGARSFGFRLSAPEVFLIRAGRRERRPCLTAAHLFSYLLPMTLSRRELIAWRRGGVAVLLAVLASCSPEREVLVTVPSSGAEGGAAIAAGGASASGAAAAGGAVRACTAHRDCDAGSVCSSNTCQACAPSSGCAAACSNGFSSAVVARNGCAVCECVPPSDCRSSQDCPTGEICYAGAQCQDGCATPDCCFGNRCAAPGCAAAAGLNCSAVGCAEGGLCFSACPAVSCVCDGSSWRCADPSSAGSANPCAWVCTSP